MRWLAGFAALLAALVFAVFQLRDYGQLRLRRNTLSGLDFACKLYAGDHHGAMPPDLRALFPGYVNSTWYLAYATGEVEYFPGATDTSNPATILMREKRPDPKGRRWVGYVDASVELEQPRPDPATRYP